MSEYVGRHIAKSVDCVRTCWTNESLRGSHYGIYIGTECLHCDTW